MKTKFNEIGSSIQQKNFVGTIIFFRQNKREKLYICPENSLRP